MKLINIVGARPQFIKAAVISRAIKAHNETQAGTAAVIEEIIVHTHRRNHRAYRTAL